MADIQQITNAVNKIQAPDNLKDHSTSIVFMIVGMIWLYLLQSGRMAGIIKVLKAVPAKKTNTTTPPNTGGNSGNSLPDLNPKTGKPINPPALPTLPGLPGVGYDSNGKQTGWTI